jgi:hypothetical protein
MKRMMALIPIVLLLMACSRSASERSDESSEPIDRPKGAADLVLRVEIGGGFVPPGVLLTQMPTFTLYGDGRVITQGPQIMIYPGPALPNLIERAVSQKGVDSIVREAARAGMLGEDRQLPLDTIADAPTTTFTLVAEDRRHVVSVYALGMEGSTRLSGRDREARKALADFHERLTGLENWLPAGSVGEERQFEIERMRVFIRPGAPVAEDPSLQQPPAEWPLPGPLSEFGGPADQPELRCGTVEGEDLKLLLPRVMQANQLTPWTSAGETYTVLFRPLLPDESGC